MGEFTLDVLTIWRNQLIFVTTIKVCIGVALKSPHSQVSRVEVTTLASLATIDIWCLDYLTCKTSAWNDSTLFSQHFSQLLTHVSFSQLLLLVACFLFLKWLYHILELTSLITLICCQTLRVKYNQTKIKQQAGKKWAKRTFC